MKIEIDIDNELTLDTSVRARSYVLIDEAEGILGTDMEMTPFEANYMNARLADHSSPWRWFPLAEKSEAA